MTSIDAAYNNIRLIRQKILIAQGEIEKLAVGAQRDGALIHLARLTADLIRALNDFADLGYEEHVADLLQSQDGRLERRGNC